METPNAEQPAEKERIGNTPEEHAEKGGARNDAAQAEAAQSGAASGGGTMAAAGAVDAAPAGQNGAGGGKASVNSGAQGVGGLRPSDVDFMPGLLRSLSVLMRLRGKPVSPQLLLAGLSGSQVTPRACLGAARKAGLSGRIASRPSLDDIPPLVLPCILLLKNDRSCVLTALRGGRAEVIFPEISDSTQTVSQEELQEDYAGYAIFAAVPKAPERRMDAPRLGRGKRWFWDVLRYYAPIYRHVALASVVINLIAVASPLFVMNVYDRVVPNNATDTLWVLASGIFVIYFFNFLLSALRTHFVDVAGRNADIVLSSALVEKVLSMRLDAKPESTGAMVNNLREFEQLREFFSSSSLLACIDLPFLVIFLLLIAFIAGPMVLLPLGAIPVLVGLGLFLQRRARQSAEAGYRQNMQKNALLVEMVGGLETLKSCMAESRMQRLWEAIAGLSAKSSSEARKYNSMAVTSAMLITQIVTVIMIVWGVYRINDGLMSMGALIGCNILVGRTMAPLLQMASLLTRVQNSRVAFKALDMLMELPSENDAERVSMDYGSLEPTFTLDDVSFSYPHSERPALEGVSLTIRPGERVGIIGPMGSGKSSLSRMLLGLYQPGEGAVRFGGVDIRQIPSADLRGRIGVLPQDVTLFYGSVRENIALGDPSINDHLVLRAAALAGVTDFIRGFPAGFASQVGEQGRALSGGQRQAVALARALVRDPEVLILDEPTSNMDTDSELLLQRRLAGIIQGRTLILITHRLSMLRIVDRLIVMENGRIKLDGPRDEVLARLRGKAPRGARQAGAGARARAVNAGPASAGGAA
ncbi:MULTISPECIES: type I secretion system permease/ATPase [unclassified Desulfovibrio]|uniref:type I secretion system permease/ATPase n=1 Tax=unclassified Desulfovibrio TaxID=2593640 RepID=UPI001F154B62|nr:MULTISPECIES: type I secretion system permease/ATPase [unclassified Desulfovibrio]